MGERENGERPVISYPPEAVLEIGHVAEWLRVSTRTVERLDVPCFYLGGGGKLRRYLAKDVLRFVEGRKTA